jgi:hypothetical protein
MGSLRQWKVVDVIVSELASLIERLKNEKRFSDEELTTEKDPQNENEFLIQELAKKKQFSHREFVMLKNSRI